jgi:hypothetical protein
LHGHLSPGRLGGTSAMSGSMRARKRVECPRQARCRESRRVFFDTDTAALKAGKDELNWLKELLWTWFPMDKKMKKTISHYENEAAENHS